MSRLAFVPLPFAALVALIRTVSGLVPLMVVHGVVEIKGFGDRQLDPAQGLGDLAKLTAGMGAVWSVLMSLSLLVVMVRLLGRRPGARAPAWTWVSVATLEVLLRAVTLALSPWIGEFPRALVYGATPVDDLCCCIPVSALWTVGFAGWLVATRDPLEAPAPAPDPAPARQPPPPPAQSPASPRPDYALLDGAAGWFDRPAG